MAIVLSIVQGLQYERNYKACLQFEWFCQGMSFILE